MKKELEIYLQTKILAQTELISIMESQKIPTIKEIILQKGKLLCLQETLDFITNLK